MKKGLEAPPVIVGTWVAVCKIDTSKMSAAVGNNKIPGVTIYNNFSFDKHGMRVWLAYGVSSIIGPLGALLMWSKRGVPINHLLFLLNADWLFKKLGGGTSSNRNYVCHTRHANVTPRNTTREDDVKWFFYLHYLQLCTSLSFIYTIYMEISKDVERNLSTAAKDAKEEKKSPNVIFRRILPNVTCWKLCKLV